MATGGVTPQCKATTTGGDRCRNKARPGSDFCGVHIKLEEAERQAEFDRVHVKQVAGQLNTLADEVKKVDPEFEPPPFTIDSLLAMMQGNAATMAKYVPSQTLNDIIANLEGTTTKDLLDLETWKGLWYILNYAMQGQAHEVMAKVARQLSAIPGMDLMMQFGASVVESPGELLNLETWKGAFIVLNAAVTANVDAVKGKIAGSQSDPDGTPK